MWRQLAVTMLYLVLVPHQRKDPMLGARPARVLGIAPPRTGRVHVFWDRIVEFAMPHRRMLTQVLSFVVTPRSVIICGPGQGHRGGVMRRYAEDSVWHLPSFTPAHSRSMRAWLLGASQASTVWGQAAEAEATTGGR